MNSDKLIEAQTAFVDTLKQQGYSELEIASNHLLSGLAMYKRMLSLEEYKSFLTSIFAQVDNIKESRLH